MATTDRLLQRAVRMYLDSTDFNGLPRSELSADEHAAARSLVLDGKLEVHFGDVHPNPHIKAFEPHTRERQLEMLAEVGTGTGCLYPTTEHLGSVDLDDRYRDRPYTLRLAQGAPQLCFYAFDLSVLETYRNDPRYRYLTDDISGRIVVSDEFYESTAMPGSDKVVLQTFGFAYDVDLNRAVAVFARYLAGLTPEHQRIWQARELGPNFKLHPDYWRQSIGEWPVGISTFTAFLDEMAEVNKVSQLIGRPSFFRHEYGGERRPPEFGFLVRPTLREFQGFVHLLDKMVSDNINIAFFGTDVPRTTIEGLSDGTRKEVVKASLRLLDEWLAQNFRFQDPEPIRLMLDAFRDVRAHRRRPAHTVDDNVFDVSYLNRQRELMLGAYHGIRVLRQVLQLHPLAHEYAPPEHLHSGTVWSY